jgi:uncharacterized protein (DUF1499 family)
MRLAGILLGLGVLALLGLAVWVRLAPSDPAVWHVDPDAVTERGQRNSYLMATGGDAAPLEVPLPPDQVAARLEAVALSTPRTTRLAGQGDFTTYITRSAAFGFPDYTSIRIRPTATGSQVLIFARSRFGDSDFGVNRARADAWIAELTR